MCDNGWQQELHILRMASLLSTLPKLDSLDVAGKRVLVRVDYNIAPQGNGGLSDDYRVLGSLPTLQKLIEKGARVGILSHRGRPGGRVVSDLSTQPFAAVLSKLLGQRVEWVPDCVGRMAEQAMADLAPGRVVLFENVRFHLGEQLNQLPFVQQLAALADVYVNDAFATAHRAHASTTGLTLTMPEHAVGELMVKELEWIERVVNTKGMVSLVLGGNNVGPKLDFMRRMLTKAKTIMLGGAVANTFIAARDLGVGQSTLDPAWVESARDLLTEAGVVGCRLHLPQDVWVTNTMLPDAQPEAKAVHEIAAFEAIHDIGPRTLETWLRLIPQTDTLAWLGALGMVERESGSHSSVALAEALVKHKGFSLVSGTGMLPLLNRTGLRTRLPAVSTGGAVLPAALAGQPLPALDVMKPR
jgi:phosphoglycerate kinase